MSKFSYWEGGESVQHDIANDTNLTPDEAQVIATLHLTRAVEKLANEFSELMYFLRNHAVLVEQKTPVKK
jgi:hypothetical protein